jgi:hypothetical protein
MRISPSIPPFSTVAALAVLLAAAGCATTDIPPPEPFRESQVEAFHKAGRDARAMGITIYKTPSGKAHFEFANRPHMGRAAEIPFAFGSPLPRPVLDLKTGGEKTFRVLVDTSARQSWLVPAACAAMDYRPFKPRLGEYPDHVDADIPGYAGVGNKIVAKVQHVESPIFYVPMAAGHLGPLARPERPADDPPLSDKVRRSRERFDASIQAVLGAEMLCAFDWIRFDFPARKVRFSSNGPAKPGNPAAVAAKLPMLDWNGRPAIAVRIDGRPATAVIDTGGDFELSLPDSALRGGFGGGNGDVRLQLGDLPPTSAMPQFAVPARTHASLGLPPDFPARVGTRILARYAVTLDFKNRSVLFEDPELAARQPDEADADEADAVPVHYRGVVR